MTSGSETFAARPPLDSVNRERRIELGATSAYGRGTCRSGRVVTLPHFGSNVGASLVAPIELGN